MTTDTALPAVRFDLRERARFDFDGAAFVAYDDGQMMDVIPAEQFDSETSEGDYSLWCSATNTAPRPVYVEAGRILGLDSFLSGANGTIRQPEAD